MSGGERTLREQDIGLYLDERGEPAGVRLFSSSGIDERMTTDSLGQFHFTRWRKFGDMGWKVDFSFVLSAQATRGLIVFIRSLTNPRQAAGGGEPVAPPATPGNPGDKKGG